MLYFVFYLWIKIKTANKIKGGFKIYFI